MRYFAREIQVSEKVQRTAGIKARDDLEMIFEQNGILPLPIPSYNKQRADGNTVSKLLWHYKIRKTWKENTAILKKGDILIIQFPVIEHAIALGGVFKKLKKSGIKIILFIHDLESLRASKRRDYSLIKRIRLALEEKNILFVADKLVVHNKKMKETLNDMGVAPDKMVSLEIFDYLISDFDKKNVDRKGVIGKDRPIIIAGTLRPHKAQYAYHLPEGVRFNLYGVDYEGIQNENIHYFGSFPPDELPFVMDGSFGLVWDGESADTCKGVYGEYLKINNPHKTSLYLASGIPVVIWKEAAIADFITENGVGITVDSLYEIEERLSQITADQYNKMVENVLRISEQLRNGVYTKKAINQSILLITNPKN